jgi:DNA-binding MarR family transcriptional regulator
MFAVMDTMDVLRRRVQKRALPLFAAWGLWHDDATLKPSAIRPVRWLLSHAPELRARALLGPSVEADVMASALAGDVTVRDVALTTHVSYAATHDAASRLVGRGLLVRERVAQRQLLRPTAAARAAFDQSE